MPDNSLLYPQAPTCIYHYIVIACALLIYTIGLFKSNAIFFALFSKTVCAIEKLLSGLNVQPRIGMNQSLF